tara:strand:+ start:978 stop:1124 length:147 start_codon:yes stop_codon:yes gene_type:complete
MTGRKKIALYNSLPIRRLEISKADPKPNATDIGTTMRTYVREALNIFA